MNSVVKDSARRLMDPVAGVLVTLRVTPNQLTVFGLLFSLAAGVLLGFGRFRVAVVAVLLGGACDMLDGAVARRSGRVEPFGAFLDSTVDRVAEMALFAGLLVYFTTRAVSPLYALLCFVAAAGSFLVSYTRARSEGLGIECRVGLMERPERLVTLLLALLIGPYGVRAALWVLSALVWWTSGQRCLHVSRQARRP